VHEFDVGLVRNNWPVYVGQWLGAFWTSSCLFWDERQCLRVFFDYSNKFLGLLIEGGVLDQVVDAFIDFLELLPVPQIGLLHGWANGGTFVVCVLEWLILHLYGDIGLLEKSESRIIDSILCVPKAGQFEQIILKDLRSFLLHVDLLGVPVAKLTEIYPQLALGIPRESEHILAVGTGEAKGAPAVLERALVHALAGATLLGGELWHCAVVAAVARAVYAGVDLFLQHVSHAFAFDLHLRLWLLRSLQEVDSCLC